MSSRAQVVKARHARWVAGVVLVAVLVVLAILVVLGAAGRQQADDPRSSTPRGAGALGALLAAEGIRVSTTDQVDEAALDAAPTRTLVVVNADLLDAAAARRLLTAGWGGVILIRPNTTALSRFGVPASSTAAAYGTLPPDCPVEAARRAGTINLTGARTSYATTGPVEFACYPSGDGHVYLRAATSDGVPVELVGGAVANSELAEDGNAAFAMNVFGARSEINWLMARAAQSSGADESPGLLPLWWEIALVQCAVAFVVVAIWRGRRLGPILSEPLPVRVRAAETVEGHGRLYFRLNARDRAAEALRAGAIRRLSTAFGHSDDPAALSDAVGRRTGRDPAEVRRLLFDAVPGRDDELVNLARNLDRLEQEARRP